VKALTLDVTTLFVTLLIVEAASCVFSAVLYATRQTFRGARLWIAGQAVAVLSTLGMLLRGWTPPVVGVLLPNALYFLAGLLLLDAVWRFRFSRPMPRTFWISLAAFTGLMGALLGSSINLRMVAYGIFAGSLSLLTGILLFIRVERPLRLPSHLLGLNFLIMACVDFARIVPAAMGPEISDFSTQGGLHAGYYLVSILSSFLTFFGYYMMSSARFETALKRKDAALERRNLQLAELNRTKGTLLSVISHDLRSPLSSAARYVRNFLLPDEVDLREKREALKTVSQSLDRYSAFLDDILLWARSQGEGPTLSFRELAVSELIEEALGLLRGAAESKGIAVRSEVGEARLTADRHSAGTVFRNLLSNAIKFSPAGGEVSVAAERKDGGLELRFADQGPGMSGEFIKNLEREERILSTLGSQGEMGNGLGLWLCRGFMRQHGGSLSISSEAGKGTTVSVWFPDREPDRDPLPAKASAAPAEARPA
jgi:signal transduction histidine kinase